MQLQRTEEWFKDRLGCVTASRLADVMAKTKTGVSKVRTNYMMELLCQRLTGVIPESFTSDAMQRGIDLESKARELYQLKAFDAVLVEVGSIPHPTIDFFRASPDGLVNDDGLVEIKCPNTATHLQFLRTGKPKREYILQMHGQMMCTERAWCDFVSYDDRLPDNLSYKCVRIYRDDALVKEIEAAVTKFLDELEQEMQFIKRVQ